MAIAERSATVARYAGRLHEAAMDRQGAPHDGIAVPGKREYFAVFDAAAGADMGRCVLSRIIAEG